MDWHAFFRAKWLVRCMFIPLQARSDTIRTAHIKAPEYRVALSASFKLMLRTGGFVLIGSNKNQAS